MNKRVLISSIAPLLGGVTPMNRFVIDTLRERNLTPVFAYHLPYSLEKSLSVPSYKLLTRKVSSNRQPTFHDCETHILGAWLPELEFTHYWPTRDWKQLIASCDYHIAISGNCLPATPYAFSGQRFLLWLASTWAGDRNDRVAQYPPLRKVIDRIIIKTITPFVEKRIIRQGRVLSLSSFTQTEVKQAFDIDVDRLSIPIDSNTFSPDETLRIPNRIGFTGRFSDPRKNIELLIKAVAMCREKNPNITLDLVGEPATDELRNLVQKLKLQNHVKFSSHLCKDNFINKVKSFDLFVVPSRQEGLCISALEAMACGCPVVSTRCGGPQEFVIDDQTGYIVDASPEKMGDAINRIVLNPATRQRLGFNARQFVCNHYHSDLIKRQFWQVFEQTFSN